jgi:hypothetical protein
MKLQVVLAGATALALVAGAAQAATHHHKASGKSAGVYNEPSQPIAYSKLDSYLKSSSRSRGKQSWGIDNTGMAAGSAATGAAANASATAPQTGMTAPTTGVAPADQGAAAPAPAAAAPNPPATQASPNASTDQQPAPGQAAQPPTTTSPQ